MSKNLLFIIELPSFLPIDDTILDSSYMWHLRYVFVGYLGPTTSMAHGGKLALPAPEIVILLYQNILKWLYATPEVSTKFYGPFPILWLN